MQEVLLNARGYLRLRIQLVYIPGACCSDRAIPRLGVLYARARVGWRSLVVRRDPVWNHQAGWRLNPTSVIILGAK
jgi:hypothetical protein